MAAPLSLAPVTTETRPILERLWQLYRHDLSGFRGMLPDEAGMFHARSLLPFLDRDGERGAHLFRTDGPVGFALVARAVSGPRLMSEFFVVRGARRQGLGRAAAAELFALYPGLWEIPSRRRTPPRRVSGAGSQPRSARASAKSGGPFRASRTSRPMCG